MKHNLVRVHTCYSIVDGFNFPDEMAKYLSENNISDYFPVTDLTNFFGYVKQTRACRKYDLKPIYGCDVFFKDVGLVTLHAKSVQGFVLLKEFVTHLYKLSVDSGEKISKDFEFIAVKNKDHVAAFLDQDQIKTIKQNGLFQNIQSGLDLYCKLDLLNPYDVSVLSDVRVVPSIDVYFNTKDLKRMHDVRVAIQDSEVMSEQESRFSNQMSFHTEGEFDELLSNHPNVDFVDIETIYSKFDVPVELDVVLLPEYPFTGGLGQDDFIKNIVESEFEKRKSVLLADNPKDSEQDYLDRIVLELDIMLGMGYAGYFGIVWDYINWSKTNDVSVGAGRGSGAGSLVAFLLGIVELDPLKYDLIFERFLNPERVSMPDVDTDFESARRDDVIHYVKERFGENYAAQICTFGTTKAKGSIKDAGRVFEKNVAALSKSIPSGPDVTLKDALLGSPKLREFKDSGDYDDVFEAAFAIEGRVRNVGRHAGGVVVSKGPIFGFTGVYYDSKGLSSVMLDMDDAESVGLVKFDFLGLNNLDIIKSTLLCLEEQGVYLDLNTIDLEDQKVYKFLQKALTLGTFQLLSSGMRALIKKLKPDCFEDIIALVALFRPGPLNSGMVDNFVDRKHGVEVVSYPDEKYQHEMLKEVLSPTYGIILYQEQVMKIAQVMAGYTLGGADNLRRAMGKKKPEEMEKQKSVFIDGSVKNDVDKDLAEKIFDLVEKFAGYGFNRSHSAVYGLIAYHTVYLKAYYPSVFMAQVLTSDGDKHDKLSSQILELASYGVSMSPPSVNECCAKFISVDEKNITYGLAAIKGIGVAFSDSLVQERSEKGKFTSLSDFSQRMEVVGINKGQFSALVFSGALDCIADYGDCLDHIAKVYGFEKTKFSISTDDESRDENQKKLCSLSFRITAQIGEFTEELIQANCIPLGDMEDVPNGRIVLCGGLTSGVKTITTKVARLVGELRDATGVVTLVGWSEFQERYEGKFNDGELYIIEAKVGSFNDKKQLELLRCWDKDFVRKRLSSST